MFRHIIAIEISMLRAWFAAERKYMNTRIILLRGVMPVGKNKVPMGQLREVLTKAGFKNVRTYRAVLINNVACFKVIHASKHENLRLTCDKTFEKRSKRAKPDCTG